MDTPETFREYRSVPFVDMDAAADGSHFVGYAAVFGQEADLGSFTESVNHGAFRKSLAAGDNVPMLLDHQEQLQPFAVTRNGSLKLSEDTKGLRVEANLATSHPHFEYLRDGVQSGMIDGMSWGFVAGSGNSRLEHRARKPHRSLMNFQKILDVSPTWDKTYATTEASFRSFRMLEELAANLETEEQDLEGVPPQPEEEAEVSEAEAVEEEHRSESVDERSGVAIRATARRRRLQMLDISLPAEFRR
jgi:HK97 family phage prohead protease